jgi:type IV secretion system protein VirB5
MKNKLKILTLAILPLLGMSSAKASGIPVVDVAGNAQQIIANVTRVAEQVETIAQWVTQIAEMKAQFAQQVKDFEALNGKRLLGKIFDDPALRDYIPEDFKEVFDAVKEGGLSGLSGTAKAAYESNQIIDTCSGIVIVEQRTACEVMSAKPSQDSDFAKQGFEQAKKRISQIESLMEAIDDTDDPKAIAEVQARIGAEQAMLQNESMKLQLYKMIAEAEDKVQVQKRRELHAKAINKNGYFEPRSLDEASELFFQ